MGGHQHGSQHPQPSVKNLANGDTRDEERLRFIRGEVLTLAEQVRVAEKLQRAGVTV